MPSDAPSDDEKQQAWRAIALRRTQLEQARGAETVARVERMRSIAKYALGLAISINYDYGTDIVAVRPYGPEYMFGSSGFEFREPLKDFPSAELHAKVALAVHAGMGYSTDSFAVGNVTFEFMAKVLPGAVYAKFSGW